MRSEDFRYHSKCEKQKLINLCFADDLFLFSRGDQRSVKVIMEAINLFKDMSGLVPSMGKSTIFFGNVPDHVKHSIRSIMSFDDGVLPVRYLGVPLISSRLQYKDCKKLVENMEVRITDWRNKSLSFAGRLQLIRSVLSSLHVYWASVFILPKRIIKELEDRMKRFLWAQGDDIKGKAKVKWKSVCVPKHEGGLGICRVADMNNALMTAHIWSVFTHRESLWVRWIHSYRLQGRSFWDVPVKSNITWSWRKMLSLRSHIRNHVWTNVGNGKTTFVWFDKWDEVCPLFSILTPRIIANAGFSLETKLCDVRGRDGWRWPLMWSNRFPMLGFLSDINLDDATHDKLVWKSRLGNIIDFGTASVWDDIRVTQPEIQWSNLIWFPQAIPRHSFIMWLIIHKKLKTQDVMCKWNTSGNANFNLMCCSLCISGPDSHEHLFFECGYASRVWDGVKAKADMGAISNRWSDIFDHLMGVVNSKKATHVISRLVVSASAYFIWNERNRRLFTRKRRDHDQTIIYKEKKGSRSAGQCHFIYGSFETPIDEVQAIYPFG
ncbi:putative RNA-directed DNA polymerase [Helianthus annuus]|nr:putative RNA-directed DNA polymerase [Helianthus annuus]